MESVNGSISMAPIFMREILVSSITHLKTNGEDRTKPIKDQIREALKSETMIITKNLISNSIDKGRALLNFRINTMNLLEIMFTKKALMSAILTLYLILKY